MTAENADHAIDIALQQGLADARRTVDFAAGTQRLEHFEGETVTTGGGGEKGRVPFAVTAEGIVVADHQVTDTEPADQDVADEIGGARAPPVCG